MNPYYLQQVERVLRSRRVKTTTPIENMPPDLVETILYGTRQEAEVSRTKSRSGHTWDYEASFEGVINNLQRRYNETTSDYVKEDIEKYMSASTCKVCNGARLKPEALAVTIGGQEHQRRSRRCRSSARETFFARATSRPSARSRSRTRSSRRSARGSGFLTNVGLGYLNLARSATTLSGGESQRIRLATQIGSSLVGVLYILDEPSIGLHQRDNDRLLGHAARRCATSATR